VVVRARGCRDFQRDDLDAYEKRVHTELIALFNLPTPEENREERQFRAFTADNLGVNEAAPPSFKPASASELLAHVTQMLMRVARSHLSAAGVTKKAKCARGLSRRDRRARGPRWPS
jgi:hypothetical protein